MQIISSQISSSSHHQLESSQQQVQARITNGQLLSDSSSEPAAALQNNASQITVSQLQTAAVTSYETLTEQDLESSSDKEYSLFKALVEALVGHRITIRDFSNSTSQTHHQTPAASSADDPSETADASVETVTLNLLDEYEYSSVSFAGRIENSAGELIEVQLSITMGRHYQQSSLELLRQQGYITDPLVINFESASTQLNNTVNSFDLDGDEQLEHFAALGSGSAFILEKSVGRSSADTMPA